MNIPTPLQERLQFLARVTEREVQHLQSTDASLFAFEFTPERVAKLPADQSLAEQVDAFVSRFGRLQDTVGDKVLPAWREAVGERPGTMADNLDRAERLGLVASSDQWLSLRKLRNRMIHDYIEDPSILADALQTAHMHVPLLTQTADAFLMDLRKRGILPGS
ncbi:hypothetical protein JKG47_21440 [Acidithiobacillus sp. MC6.1]|nr:hypothetical protein [Acidithiobacillus sp. MC6.1]